MKHRRRRGLGMCGIVGWVDFTRDLRRERAAVLAMAAAVSLRGPDDEGVWLDPHCGLGHRRLAVVDPEHSVQPMTAEHDGEVVAAVTFSGEIYNFARLRDELQASGHKFRTTGDTEVLLHAYLEWGEDFVDRIEGMFAFGLWDARRRQLLLVRDRMGIKPLFYKPTSDGVLFASELKGLLAHPGVTAEITLGGLRELLSFAATPGHSVYRDVHQVLPGEIVRVDRDGLHRRRYWTVTTEAHTDDLDATVAHVRELLDRIVTDQLVADVPLGVLLSGGLDSSALTALAQRAAGEPIRSFSVDFTGQAENFRPDDLRSTHDAPYIAAMVEHAGTTHETVQLAAADALDRLNRTGTLLATEMPSPIGDMNVSLHLLFRGIRDHVTVALSGEAADEVFGGYRWFHEPDLINADTFPWMAALGPQSSEDNNSMSLWNADLTATLGLTEYRNAAYRDALAEVKHLDDADATERRMREISYLNLTRFLPVLLDRKDRTSMATGLEVRVPFADHRLVQYVYNVPWAMKAAGGVEKSLLRAAVADLLPQSILERRKSAYPSIQDPAYDPMLRERLSEVLADTSSPLVPLLNAGSLTMLTQVPYEYSPFATTARRGVELVLSLDEWMRRFPVRLVLDRE
ncbi:asparagine synthase (glutamine-hydrolyzing) [Micromonospora sp. NPDC050397]|uniref:asparagine synthase (glutamine-hydrolyzing) n=1 Tax=Micromonospora sp. NPDC050397 TaxID=3364279 RepID=UPI00384C66D3